MKRLLVVRSFFKRLRFGVLALDICWIGGLILGMLTAFWMKDVVIPMIYTVLPQAAGGSGLLVASVLPCLLCAYGVGLGEFWVLPLVGGFKTFGFGFCGCAVALAFGQSGWLVRLLLLFSDCMILGPLYFFSLRHICGRTSRASLDIAVLLSMSAVVCFVDYCVISPFLCQLFL